MLSFIFHIAMELRLHRYFYAWYDCFSGKLSADSSKRLKFSPMKNARLPMKNAR